MQAPLHIATLHRRIGIAVDRQGLHEERMNKFRFPVLEAVATTAILSIAVTVALLLFPALKSEASAAWVQAIGSIGAILVAIWVSAEQQRKQGLREAEREEAEVDGMLRSVRSEIETMLEAVHERVGKALEGSAPGSRFDTSYPIADEPFRVYYGLIPKLGMIKGDQLRKRIVATYAHAHGLVMTFQYNNELILRYNAALVRARSEKLSDVGDLESAELTLRTYGDGLRSIYSETKSQAHKLLAMLPTR
jgi:hypothetical protein